VVCCDKEGKSEHNNSVTCSKIVHCEHDLATQLTLAVVALPPGKELG
jgi:hypothetical protein